MTTFSIVFWLFAFACIGAVVGGLIERFLNRRAVPRVPPIPSDNNLAKEGDLEILRAWRTFSNKIWLEMDGSRIENKEALKPEQRQRLINLVLDLRTWLDAPRPAAPAPAPAPSVPEPATQPKPITIKPAVVDRKKDKVVEETKPVLVLKSIVQQIDEVLQVKLLTSTYKDRKIALVEGPGGTVIVQDGANLYEGIDAVPDPEVKALIRLAVAEWEKGSH
jgi:hypothetical protein